MSLFERVVNRMTANPEADDLMNKELAAKQSACNKEIAVWNEKQTFASTDDFKKTTLAEDVLYFQQFINVRLGVLKPRILSQNDIDILNDNTDTVNYNKMMKTRGDRYAFKTRLTDTQSKFQGKIKVLQDKGTPVPPCFPQVVQLMADSLKWFEITKFVDKSVYTDKMSAIDKQAKDLLKEFAADLNNPDAAAAAAQEKHNEDQQKFNPTGMILQIITIVAIIVGVFLLVFLGIFGASLATNLNLYRSAPFRVLYMIYGFIFCFLVIPYVLLYRWWWKGKRPLFYAFIPLVPYHFDNYYAGQLFSWMSYRPDDQIASLKEWEKEQSE